MNAATMAKVQTVSGGSGSMLNEDKGGAKTTQRSFASSLGAVVMGLDVCSRMV